MAPSHVVVQLFRSGPHVCLWIYHRWGYGSVYRERCVTEVRTEVPVGADVVEAVTAVLRAALTELESRSGD